MKRFVLLGGAIGLFSAGIAGVQLAAEQKGEVGGKSLSAVAAKVPEYADKLQVMIRAARQTYAAVEERYHVGAETPTQLYMWSNRWRASEVRAATTNDKMVKACEEHLERMKNLQSKVSALANQGAQGGETDKLRATEFYVAEATVMVLDAKDE